MRLLTRNSLSRATRGALSLLIVFSLNSFSVATALPRTQATPAATSPQDARNAQGETALTLAAASGNVSAVKSLLEGGAGLNATDAGGRTALIVAVQNGQVETVRALMAAGADLNVQARYIGSALNVAENNGDVAMATMLQAAGAKTTGKSVGDTVCVTPWGGQGFCGVVREFSVKAVKLDVKKIVGCEGGCPARQECSASNPVGGVNGLHEGEQIEVPSWCLTRTGVK